MVAVLGSVAFERLERLTVKCESKALALVDLRVLGADGAPWLARLSRLELAARATTRESVWAAALDPDGPLRALHRAGGEVALLPDRRYSVS